MIQTLRLPSLSMLSAAVLIGCGGGHSSQADQSHLAVSALRDGPTPFVRMADFDGSGMTGLSSLHYVVAAKVGATAVPVDITYSLDALKKRGYATVDKLTLPVFGLYAGYTNSVTIDLNFSDGSTKRLPVNITTPAYADPAGTYAAPNIIKAHAAGSGLGFSYMALKSAFNPLVVIDTDGQIRWVGTSALNSASTAFRENAFVTGDPKSTGMLVEELDGTTRTAKVKSTTYTGFHHNIDPGKTGLLAEFDALIGGVTTLESSVAEISTDGTLLKEWNIAQIVNDYMYSQGDDPTNFVRPGVDWFHNNANYYDPRDDSIIVSSRENFVMKIDYATGRIVWILGDPTKYWYTFPSLRAKSLTLASGGLYPIGQHAVSITSDGLLMLFNDGFQSQNQPSDAPKGENRVYSAVSAYQIDATTMTATEAWNFDYNKSIYSDICSSAYEGPSKSILVTYSTASNRTKMRLVALDAQHNVALDFEYPAAGCNTSWNSIPLPLDKLKID